MGPEPYPAPGYRLPSDRSGGVIMATFILQAVPATFHQSGGNTYCTVAMRAVPLLRETIEAGTEGEAMRAMDSACAGLDRAGVPYSISMRLASPRAPRGFKAWRFDSTRRDNALGVFA